MNSFYNFRRAQLLAIESPISLRLQEDALFTKKDLGVRRETLSDAAGETIKTVLDGLMASEEEDRSQLKIASVKPINMSAVRKGKAARRRWRSELNGILGLCKEPACPHNCSRHVDKETHLPAGVCTNGKCVCFPGGQEDCGERTCFKDCNNHGHCLHGRGGQN